MLKILWIVDGVGWGYDNLSKAIAEKLTQYEHVMIAKEVKRVMFGGKSGFICEEEDDFIQRVDAIDADLIVSMNPNNKRFIRNKQKGIVRLSGIRALNGWRR